jgi:hypothetical protein
MMVNEGDGYGRAAANVVALRAVFVDDDAGALPPGSERLAALPPSFSVRSKRGFHHYWLLAPGEPLCAFPQAQLALAQCLGTDPAVKDLPRVMRVPGFLHQKDPSEPFLVEFIPGTAIRHTLEQVRAAFPAPDVGTPPPQDAPRPSARRPRRTPRGDAGPVLEAFRGLKLYRWALEHPDSVSYAAWRGIATNIAAVVVDDPSLEEDALELFDEISGADEARYSRVTVERAFRGALKSAEAYGPMTFATLMAAGVPEDICSGATIARAPVGVARELAARRQGARRWARAGAHVAGS